MLDLEENLFSQDIHEQPFITDECFRDNIKKGLYIYLDHEVEHILKYLLKSESLLPIPRAQIIIKSQKENKEFLNYIINCSGRFKKLVQSKNELSLLTFKFL
jgi:hypothetical protein